MTKRQLINALEASEVHDDIEVLTENEEEIIRVDDSEHGFLILVTYNDLEQEFDSNGQYGEEDYTNNDSEDELPYQA